MTTSKLHRLLRKRITVKKRRPAPDGTPRDLGVSLMQVVVAMALISILGVITIPRVTQLIGEGEETVLKANIQDAAEAAYNVMSQTPHLNDETSTPTGALQNDTLADLSAAAPFEWVNGVDTSGSPGEPWQLTVDDTPETVRVQFIRNATAAAQGDGHTSPAVPWIDSNRAMRIQMGDTEGRWACALIVWGPEVERSHYGGTAADSVKDEAASLDNAEMQGIWYHAGLETSVGGASSNKNCDPALDAATPSISSATDAGYVDTANEWAMGGTPGSCSGGSAPASTTESACTSGGGTWTAPTSGVSLARNVPDFDT